MQESIEGQYKAGVCSKSTRKDGCLEKDLILLIASPLVGGRELDVFQTAQREWQYLRGCVKANETVRTAIRDMTWMDDLRCVFEAGFDGKDP